LSILLMFTTEIGVHHNIISHIEDILDFVESF